MWNTARIDFKPHLFDSSSQILGNTKCGCSLLINNHFRGGYWYFYRKTAQNWKIRLIQREIPRGSISNHFYSIPRLEILGNTKYGCSLMINNHFRGEYWYYYNKTAKNGENPPNSAGNTARIHFKPLLFNSSSRNTREYQILMFYVDK